MRLRRLVASSFVVGSRERAAQFALPLPTCGCRGFSPRQLRLRTSDAARELCPCRTHMLVPVGDRPRWLLTLCALRLGEPQPNVATSDVLCRPGAARAKAPTLAFAACCLTYVGRRAEPRRQDPRRGTRLEATTSKSPGRLPSASISILRPSEVHRSSCYGPREAPRTLSPGALDWPPRRGTPPHRATSRCLGSPLGSPRAPRGRCFSPTSATDIRHEHPQIARLPGSQLAL